MTICFIDMPNAKHTYNVEVEAPEGYLPSRHYQVTVSCTNRNQAAAIARRNGFTVRSVNMVG